MTGHRRPDRVDARIPVCDARGPRSSVTTALHVLEGNHLLYSERNLITIRDRKALELFAATPMVCRSWNTSA